MTVIIVGPDDGDIGWHIQLSTQIGGEHFRIEREVEERSLVRREKALDDLHLLVDRLGVCLVLVVIRHTVGKRVRTILRSAQADRPDGIDIAILHHSAPPEIQHAFTILEPIPIGSRIARGR
jgi:hypothetical protein